MRPAQRDIWRINCPLPPGKISIRLGQTWQMLHPKNIIDFLTADAARHGFGRTSGVVLSKEQVCRASLTGRADAPWRLEQHGADRATTGEFGSEEAWRTVVGEEDEDKKRAASER